MARTFKILFCLVLVMVMMGCGQELAVWEQGDDVKNARKAIEAFKIDSEEKEAIVFLGKWVDVCNKSDMETLRTMIYLSNGDPEKKFIDTLKQGYLHLVLNNVQILEEKSNRLICRSVISSSNDSDNLIVVDFTLIKTNSGYKMSSFKPYKGEYYHDLGKEMQNQALNRFGTSNLSQLLGYAA